MNEKAILESIISSLDYLGGGDYIHACDFVRNDVGDPDNCLVCAVNGLYLEAIWMRDNDTLS